MRVLLVCEDCVLDPFIARPVIQAVLEDIGWHGRLDVLMEPRLRGIEQALHPSTVSAIIEANPMASIFVFALDRDCDRANNTARALELERLHPDRVIVCLAVQEVETWMLALHRSQLSESWSEIRAHCDPKEAYAEPLLERLDSAGPGRGRKRAMDALRGQLRGLLAVCEELAELRRRLIPLVTG